MLDVTEGVALYTDGSSNSRDRTGGWAYVAVDAFDGEMRAWGAETDTTNNRMEMWAVAQGLSDLFYAHGACDVLVFSDSEYVVLGAQNPLRARNVNVDLWAFIDASARLHSYVEYEHVRGHKGNFYNEMVDKLAVMARKGQV
jgi:ribonuclease HI